MADFGQPIGDGRVVPARRIPALNLDPKVAPQGPDDFQRLLHFSHQLLPHVRVKAA